MPLSQIEKSCGTCHHFSEKRVCEKTGWEPHESEKCAEYKTPAEAVSALSLDVTKLVEDKMQAFGWLYVCTTKDGRQVVDHSGDVVKIATIEKAAYEYVLKGRSAGELHQKEEGEIVEVGRLIESIVFTSEKRAAMGIPEGILPDGMWVGYQVDDAEVWEKLKSGEYKMLSLGSRVIPREIGA